MAPWIWIQGGNFHWHLTKITSGFVLGGKHALCTARISPSIFQNALSLLIRAFQATSLIGREGELTHECCSPKGSLLGAPSRRHKGQEGSGQTPGWHALHWPCPSGHLSHGHYCWGHWAPTGSCRSRGKETTPVWRYQGHNQFGGLQMSLGASQIQHNKIKFTMLQFPWNG